MKLVVLPINGLQETTVDYSKSIKKDIVLALFKVINEPPEIILAFT